jgi:hypothetical protein
MILSTRQRLASTLLAVSLSAARCATGADIGPGATAEEVALTLGEPRFRMVLQDGTHLEFADGTTVVIRNGKVVSVGGPAKRRTRIWDTPPDSERSFFAEGVFSKTNTQYKASGFSFSPKSAFACWNADHGQMELYFLPNALSLGEEQRLLSCCTNRSLTLEQTLNSLGYTNARNNWHFVLKLPHSRTNLTAQDIEGAEIYVYGGITRQMDKADVTSLTIDRTALGGTVACAVKYECRIEKTRGFELSLADVTLRAPVVEHWTRGERNVNILRLEDMMREAGFKEKKP